MPMYIQNISAVVIGFDQIDYTINEDAGTVMLSVSIQNGSIPEMETRIITFTTTDGTAQCMLILIAHISADASCKLS